MPEGAFQHLAERLASGSVPGTDGVQLSEIALPAQINLRGDAGEAAFRRGVQSDFGLELAIQANTFTRNGALRCLWLGPDEWLIVDPKGSAEDLVGRLHGALAGQHVSVIDVTAAHAVLRLTGKHAREVLAKACPLDLHPRAFRPGQCAQSNFARTQAIIALDDDAPLFHLFVRRSFAEYLAQWLLDAMGEYHVDGQGRD